MQFSQNFLKMIMFITVRNKEGVTTLFIEELARTTTLDSKAKVTTQEF